MLKVVIHGGNTKIATCDVDRAGKYCINLLSTEEYGFRPNSTDVDRGIR